MVRRHISHRVPCPALGYQGLHGWSWGRWSRYGYRYLNQKDSGLYRSLLVGYVVVGKVMTHPLRRKRHEGVSDDQCQYSERYQ